MQRTLQAWGAVTVAALLWVGRASAAEPDSAEPSVCSPPCAEGETCVGTTCVGPTARRAAPPPPPAETEPPLPAAASGMTGGSTAGSPLSPPQPGNTPAAPAHMPPSGYPQRPPASIDSTAQAQRTAAVSAAPAGPRAKRGFVMLPYLGIHSYQNQEARAYRPGLRIGSLFGARVSERLSINGELTVDRTRIESPADVQQWFFRTSLSPLFHLPAGPVEVALGPKVGIYSVSTNYDGTGQTIESADYGYSTGLNTGVVAPLSPRTAITGLLSFDLMWSKRVCASGFGGTVPCGSTTDVGKVLGLTGGLLF